MKKILRGDVEAQLRTLTVLMRDVLRYVNDGQHVHGRDIAQLCRIPYPQAYNMLNSLSARGFLDARTVWGEGGARKAYHLTAEGQELLAQAENTPNLGESSKRRTAAPVDPERYVHRMRIGSVLRWLQEHGVVGSYEELVHVMKCAECNTNIRQYGFTGDVRCKEAADKVNDKEWA